MRLTPLAPVLIACSLAAPLAMAQGTPAPQRPANEQVVVPEVDRRDVKLPKFPSKDIEVGVFLGTYATENFGASLVKGVRLGYHLSEDIFVEGTLASTTVTDETFRQILPGGVFTDDKEKLTYYNLSAGYNLLPGEVFIGSKRAKATQVYLIGGVGSTKFNEQRRQTLNFGLGLRLMLADRWALQVDMRDHIFSIDLLGKRQSTQNLELTGGLAFFF
ncbi:outer membrane beta-barrel domain-containing protein [Piscinibacter sp. XHJ-5]|uniref:outer membrane beta-barrel domain-containing protein n=1 Tax=Piscinibacter sp. XHJ-5 TaxID=3037797 RepID=UPI0024530AC6|nr:outer membrane beta-barrel domain-containing protein [Piscinibacter sp. XHJ-5]